MFLISTALYLLFVHSLHAKEGYQRKLLVHLVSDYHRIENASNASMNPAIAPTPTNPFVAVLVRFLCLCFASSRSRSRPRRRDGDLCAERGGDVLGSALLGSETRDSGLEVESGYERGFGL